MSNRRTVAFCKRRKTCYTERRAVRGDPGADLGCAVSCLTSRHWGDQAQHGDRPGCSVWPLFDSPASGSSATGCVCGVAGGELQAGSLQAQGQRRPGGAVRGAGCALCARILAAADKT